MRVVIVFETLVVGSEVFPPEVPFPCVEGRVTALPERFRDGDFLERELVGVPGCHKLALPVSRPGNPVRDVDPDGVFPSHEGGPGGRTDGGGGVGVREADTVAGELVEMRCLVEGRPVTRQVGPAEVVHEEEQKVGLFVSPAKVSPG